MKTYFISDLHFSHKNIILYEKRPFLSVEEMNQELITKWNKKVTKEDTVFVLGDFSFDSDILKTEEFFKSLNGEKIFIKGNHDDPRHISTWLKNASKMTDYKRIKLEGKDIIMSHYPFNIWDQSHRGSISLHGHVHSKHLFIPSKNQYNVSCEILGYEPCTLDEVIKKNIEWNKFWED